MSDEPADSNGKNGRRKREEPPAGFFTSLFRPWKRQRVTLTPTGKRAAAGKGRPKKAKKAAKQEAAKPPAAKKGAQAGASGAPSARQRQVNELKTLAKIGRRDPARLAQIITKMLLEDEQRSQEDRRRFERMVWEKAEKHNPKNGKNGAG